MALIRTSNYSSVNIGSPIPAGSLIDYTGTTHTLPFTTSNAAWGGVVINTNGYSTLTYSATGNVEGVGVIGVKTDGTVTTLRTLSGVSAAVNIDVTDYALVTILFGNNVGLLHTFSIA